MNDPVRVAQIAGDVPAPETSTAVRVKKDRREALLIALLFAIMLVKGVTWSLAFPLWQGPDEDDHYAVIQFIGEMGRLPDEGDIFLPDEVALSRDLADVGRLPYAPEQRQTFSDSSIGPGEVTFADLPRELRTSFELKAAGKLMHATPLYYILGAQVYRLFEDRDLLARVAIQRLLAVLLGSPLVVVAYLIARLLFPGDGPMRITVPTLVAFQPMITEITAVVSVDGFFFVCYSLLIYLSLVSLRDGLNGRRTLLIGITFVVGLLVKPTINGFAPLIVLLVVYDWWRHGKPIRRTVRHILLLAITVLVPASWWMLRSLRLNEDLFYFNPVTEGHRLIQNPFYDYGILTHMFDYYQSVWGGIFATWWAHFGWLDTALPAWIYSLLRALTLLAIAGLLLLVLRRRRKTTLISWRRGMTSAPLLVWLFLALAILFPIGLLQVYDLSFWREYGIGRGLQGRYWLGTVVPMLTFFVMGLLALTPKRWEPLVHNGLRLGMVLLNVASLLGYIIPRYYL